MRTLVTVSFNLQSLIASPEYYPLKLEGENLVFVRMNRSTYQQSIFTMEGRIKTSAAGTWSVPFKQIVDAISRSDLNNPPAGCIYHIAHCGSTLLSRALDIDNKTLVIREPYVLRQICASPPARNRHEVETRSRALAIIWQLLSRRFNNESVIVKANVPVNYCIAEMNGVIQGGSEVYLYSNLQEYLSSILKSDERAHWVAHLIKEMGSRIKRIAPFQDLDLNTLTTAQSTAVLWASQIHNYERAQLNKASFSLNSQTWFSKPSSVLQDLGTHFNCGIDKTLADEITENELFRTYSKAPNLEFSEAQRVAGQMTLQNKFKTEYEDTIEWLDSQNLSIKHSLT